MANIFQRFIQHSWNAFKNRETADPTIYPTMVGAASYYNNGRAYRSYLNDQSIINVIINRIAIDVATTTIQHVYVDDKGRYVKNVDSGLNNCLTVEANLDQSARAFLQDVAETLLSDGTVAICPIETDDDIQEHMSFEIETMRVGQVTQWFTNAVRVKAYNDLNGQRGELIFPKRAVALPENPFAPIMNEPNSTLKRLANKLSLLDAVDEQSGSGKLDLIIQLPYVVRNELKEKTAKSRIKDLENQLMGSKYGIAYIDGSEKVTQLNRPVDNNLMSQIEYLTSMLYSQLGLTVEILNGTADEQTMLNYYNRTIEPIVSAIVDEMYRKFLTKTARTRKQKIIYYRDPFKLVPVGQLAEIADKFTRNEIMSPNEIRQIIGMAPVNDPKADELRNRNLNEESDHEPVYATDPNSDETDVTAKPMAEIT